MEEWDLPVIVVSFDSVYLISVYKNLLEMLDRGTAMDTTELLPLIDLFP